MGKERVWWGGVRDYGEGNTIKLLIHIYKTAKNKLEI